MKIDNHLRAWAALPKRMRDAVAEVLEKAADISVKRIGQGGCNADVARAEIAGALLCARALLVCGVEDELHELTLAEIERLRGFTSRKP